MWNTRGLKKKRVKSVFTLCTVAICKFFQTFILWFIVDSVMKKKELIHKKKNIKNVNVAPF